MRKILSILLVLSICFTAVGFYPVFIKLQYQVRQEIKHRIKKGIPETELHKITFAQNEKIDWVRDGKEFRLKGEMFDVVRKEILNGNTIYHCINDKEEKALFAILDELVKEQMQDEESSEGSTAQLLFKIFSQTCITPVAFILEFSYSYIIMTFHVNFDLPQVFLAMDFPPPDLA